MAVTDSKRVFELLRRVEPGKHFFLVSPDTGVVKFTREPLPVSLS